MSESMIIGMFLFLLGSIFGSFLNVCIVRLPLEQSVVKPRSHCFACKKTIPWYHNIPIISYFLLRGKCNFCGAKFSFRYVFVEILTGILFVWLYFIFGLTGVYLAYTAMFCGFIVATFVDFSHRIIPDEISVGGTYAGMVFSLLVPQLHSYIPPVMTAGRILMWGLIGILALGFVWEIFVAKRPLEKGDGAFFIFVGLFLALEFLLNWVIKSGYNGKFLANILSLHASIIGMFVAGGLIYALGVVGDIIFRKESMGGGDVKLMAMIGAFFGK